MRTYPFGCYIATQLHAYALDGASLFGRVFLFSSLSSLLHSTTRELGVRVVAHHQYVRDQCKYSQLLLRRLQAVSALHINNGQQF